MNLKRLENNHFAIEASNERLSKALDDGNETEAFISVSELLLWIITTEEWHLKYNHISYKKKRANLNNGAIIKSLRYPYNALKHNMQFVHFYQITGGMRFPFSFPLTIKPIKAVWVDVEEFKGEGLENQRKNYNNYLQGKVVKDTLQEVIQFLIDQKSLLKEGG